MTDAATLNHTRPGGEGFVLYRLRATFDSVGAGFSRCPN